jgi:hypothetical protein
MRLPFITLCVSILIYGCNKEKENNNTNNSSEYIKGEFDGTELIFDKRPDDRDDQFFYNVYIYNEATNSDVLRLARRTSDNFYQASFYISESQLHTQSLPYSLPSNVNSGRATLTFTDVKHPITNQCEFCPLDSVNYLGSSIDLLKVTVTDTADNYLKGNFDGVIATGSGKSMEVKNGSFNIKYTRVSNW